MVIDERVMKKKCPVCSKRKGKRNCPLYSFICSACCGEVREGGNCPSDCPYYRKGQQFSKEKELTKMSEETRDKLDYYKKNVDRLSGITTAIEKGVFDIIDRDIFYTDKVIIEGLRRCQLYFAHKHQDDDDMLLNRIGVIENSVKAVITRYKLEKESLTLMDIDSTLEGEIFKINHFIMEGSGTHYIETIREHYAESKSENSLIIP